MLKLLLVGATTVVGWNHLLSFNTDCSATFNVLSGTKAAGAMTANRIPWQFVNSLKRVMKARVAAAPGCSEFDTNQALYDKLFGLDFINVLRLLDSSDTTLTTAQFPATCNETQFDFNWKKIRQDFAGVALPDTCRAAAYAANPDAGCKAKWSLLSGFDIEVSIRDSCKRSDQWGYLLPQVEFRCNGDKCASLGKPCLTNNDCTGGLTCDFVPDAFLDEPKQFLIDIGLFNETWDTGCQDSVANGNFTFTEQFFSKIANHLGEFLGISPALTNYKWKQLKLCGVQTFADQYIPTSAPTPVPTYRCDNGTLIAANQVCDTIQDCDMGEDEISCSCGNGRQFDSFNGACCAPCENDGPCQGSFISQHCGFTAVGNSGPTFCTADQVTNVFTCPALQRSTYSPPAVPLPAFKSVPNTQNSRIMGWTDCTGNVQIGNSADLGSLNAVVPFHEIASRLETVIKETQACRQLSAVDPTFLRKQFYLWGVSFLGGAFFTNLQQITEFHGHTPGSNFDRTFRWYASADERNWTTNEYLVNPPFADLANAPQTCNSATVYDNTGGKCELNAEIKDWFKTPGFPPTWSQNPATVQLYAASTCSDALPEGFVVCTGKCENAMESGCCMMSKPWVLAAGGACPSGYSPQTIDSDITDFLFADASAANSQDTTLINFLTLLSSRQMDFGPNQFVPVGAGQPRTICMINGSSFDQNVEAWGNKTYTEDCVSGGRGCPRLLNGGGLTACGSGNTPCVNQVTPRPCPATGCPITGNTNGAWLVSPALGVLLSLILFA